MVAGVAIRRHTRDAARKHMRRTSHGDLSRQNLSSRGVDTSRQPSETFDGHSRTSAPMDGSTAVVSTIPPSHLPIRSGTFSVVFSRYRVFTVILCCLQQRGGPQTAF